MHTAVTFQVRTENGTYQRCVRVCTLIMCEAVWSAALGLMSSRPQGNSGMAQAHWALKGGAVMDLHAPFCMAPSFFVSTVCKDGDS